MGKVELVFSKLPFNILLKLILLNIPEFVSKISSVEKLLLLINELSLKSRSFSFMKTKALIDLGSCVKSLNELLSSLSMRPSFKN